MHVYVLQISGAPKHTGFIRSSLDMAIPSYLTDYLLLWCKQGNSNIKLDT